MRSRFFHFMLSFIATGLVLGTGIIGSDVLAAEKAKPAATSAADSPARANPQIGSSSGLPLPRFVSLRADAVNMRVGPGDQYPILWIYHRVDLPVEVLREFDVWRLVIDSMGTKGWMHEATLSRQRGFVINGTAEETLYRRPSIDARPRAMLMPGTVGTIQRCDTGSAWCRVRVDHMGGWLKRSAFWGTLPGETIPAP